MVIIQQDELSQRYMFFLFLNPPCVCMNMEITVHNAQRNLPDDFFMQLESKGPKAVSYHMIFW